MTDFVSILGNSEGATYMLFGLLKKADPPLTALCMRTSERAILNVARGVDPQNEHKRALVLYMLTLMAAGSLVGKSLKWGEMGAWKGSHRHLRDTNLDIITAEGIIWITFLMGQFWSADAKKDREMFSRIGFGTTSTAGEMALQTIKSETGFDFRESAVESRRLYSQSSKDGRIVDAFGSVVAGSVGCRSFAEPRKVVGPVPPLEFVQIYVSVGLFYTSIASAYYETFKRILREWSDQFPHDGDFDEDQ